MRVWIDQSQCLNSGLCEETAPDLFTLGDDDLAYVKQDDGILAKPGGESCQAGVPESREEDVELAARECPAQCIHLVAEERSETSGEQR
jgi:ferredoxin